MIRHLHAAQFLRGPMSAVPIASAQSLLDGERDVTRKVEVPTRSLGLLLTGTDFIIPYRADD